MNPAEYLESVRNFLLADSHISGHQILREYEEEEKSYLRARLTLADDSILEFSEFIELEAESGVKITAYSYHWTKPDGTLLRRWDNARHYPQLENFPHHIHVGENEVVSSAPTNIFTILDEIAKIITG